MLTDPVLMTGLGAVALTCWAGYCVNRAGIEQQAMRPDFAAPDLALQIARFGRVSLRAHAWRLMTFRDPATLYAGTSAAPEGAPC